MSWSRRSPSPADAIVEYAEKNGIDLIVIGNKGAERWGCFLIGSVSSKVVSHAPCSVMVVGKPRMANNVLNAWPTKVGLHAFVTE